LIHFFAKPITQKSCTHTNTFLVIAQTTATKIDTLKANELGVV